MRVLFVIETCILAWTTGTAWAQSPSAALTRVCQIGVYGCPNHSDIQATWPARCPMCQAVLGQVPPSAATRVGPTAVADRDDRRRNEQARERARNEELRERARRNEELREQARRNEELRERERFRRFGYVYPPYTYVYPPRGYYNPNYGYYYYDPSTGSYYYYNPNTGYYYYPNQGYYYNPNTGQYYYSNPGNYYPNYGY